MCVGQFRKSKRDITSKIYGSLLGENFNDYYDYPSNENWSQNTTATIVHLPIQTHSYAMSLYSDDWSHMTNITIGDSNYSTVSTDSNCYILEYDRNVPKTYVSGVWLGLCIPLGLILGIILAVLIYRYNSRRKKNKQNNVDRLSIGSNQQPFSPASVSKNGNYAQFLEEEQVATTSFEVLLKSSENSPSDNFNYLINESENNAEIIILTDESKCMQDLEAKLISNRNDASNALVQVNLNGLQKQYAIDKKVIDEIISKFKQDLMLSTKNIQNELTEKLKNPAAAKSNLEAKLKRMKHDAFKHNLQSLQKNLIMETELTNEQIRPFMNRIQSNLQDLEMILGDLLNVQIQLALENSISKSKYREKLKTHRHYPRETVETALKCLEKVLKDLSIDSKSVLPILKSKLQKLELKNCTEVNQKLQELSERRRIERKGLLEKFSKKCESEMQHLEVEAESVETPEQMLQIINSTIESQTKELMQIIKDLDNKEFGAAKTIVDEVIIEFEKSLESEMKNNWEEMNKSLGLPNSAVVEIQRQYELELKHQKKLIDLDAKAFKEETSKNQEKNKKELVTNLCKIDEDQNRLYSPHLKMLNNLVDDLPEINDRAKQEILNEYESNKKLISSINKLDRIKQFKKFESELARRKNEVLKNPKNLIEPKFTEKMSELENEKEKMEQELRDSLITQTNALLDEENNILADVIARLQVSHTRRQVYLDRQKKLLEKMKNLQEFEFRLCDISNGEGDVTSPQLDSLLKEHKENVNKLNESMELMKNQQLKRMHEKMQIKRRSSLGSRTSLNSTSNSYVHCEHEHELILKEKFKDEFETVLLEQRESFLTHLAGLLKLTPHEIENLIHSVIT